MASTDGADGAGLRDEFNNELARLKQAGKADPAAAQTFSARALLAVRQAAAIVHELGGESSPDPIACDINRKVEELERYARWTPEASEVALEELVKLLNSTEVTSTLLMQPAPNPFDEGVRTRPYDVRMNFGGR